MNRQEFNILKMFAALVISALEALMEGRWKGVTWQKKQSKFWDALESYEKDYVVKGKE